MGDLISREDTKRKVARKLVEIEQYGPSWSDMALCALDTIDDMPAVDAEPVTGETSDGYHTFNELYHHRAMLFSVIVKAFPDKAWKARKHHDGSMYDGMFIVGVETPDGQASYHYDIDPYWDIFKCRELEYAPEWDGHTPAQAIERIGRLEPVRRGEWIECLSYDEDGYTDIDYKCSVCGRYECSRQPYCHCGARMKEEGSV